MQLTKFTPYPGTPSYPTIQEYGSFVEDWENMNAMNFVFVPNGLDEATLERWFHRLYRAFYSRPDVLIGLAKVVLEEPRFLGRLRGYAGPFVAGTVRQMWRSRRGLTAGSATPQSAT
jgi:anaerobic magnesium-protoporphyrin IX monomethyl ester cyclase